MKLIHKLNKQYIFFSFLVLILAGTAIYFILKYIIDDETNEKLVNTYQQIIRFEKNEPGAFELYPFISVQPNSGNYTKQSISDTLIWVADEWELYRQVTNYININGTKYKVTVRESGLESDDLLKTLSLVIFLSFITIIVLLYVINKKIAHNIWHPYFDNLNKLKQFSIQSLTPFIPTHSNIQEFEEMNLVLKSLTDKVISDYDNLKKFSENASHELQTPLAIIRSKIETLLDENNLTQAQIDKISTIYSTINRLSKINSGLVLLTKIENNQFSDMEEIDLNNLIKTQYESFDELMTLRNITYKYISHQNTLLTGNKILIEMLINNLFSNAILHNTENGEIIVELDILYLKFSNSAKSKISDSDKLFERFFKSGSTGSTGLGLSIANQICINMNWKITYEYLNSMHVFIVHF